MHNSPLGEPWCTNCGKDWHYCNCGCPVMSDGPYRWTWAQVVGWIAFGFAVAALVFWLCVKDAFAEERTGRSDTAGQSATHSHEPVSGAAQSGKSKNWCGTPRH